MRVLYLTSSIRMNGRSHLRGHEFARLLKQEESLLVRHCWADDRRAALAENGALEFDLTDEAELGAFGADVIFAERGIGSSPGRWRLPQGYLENFVNSGGVVIVEGLDLSELEGMPIENRRQIFEFFGARPERGFDAWDVGRIHDEVNNSGHGAEILCHPGNMLCSPWLRPTFEGIDEIVAGSAVPLTTLHSILASSDPTAAILASDRFVSEGGRYPWASVRQIGHGFAVLLAAGVSHDVYVSGHPDNARWLSNVMKFLVDEAARNAALYSGGEGRGTPQLDIGELIAGGETQHCEFKDSALSDRHMKDEVVLTAAAFANADGGVLLIGVEDDGTIPGIDREVKQAQSDDRYLLRLGDLLREGLDPPLVGAIRTSLETRHGRRLVVVAVERSVHQPVWVTRRGAQPELYVRNNAASQKLTTRDAHQYIAANFPRP